MIESNINFWKAGKKTTQSATLVEDNTSNGLNINYVQRQSA